MIKVAKRSMLVIQSNPTFAPPPSDPLQSVLQTLERQHEEEKRSALERQRQMYEQELEQLRQRLDASGSPVGGAGAVTSPGSHKALRRWSQDR